MTRVRREMGQDIAGACGQLALNEKAAEVGVSLRTRFYGYHSIYIVYLYISVFIHYNELLHTIISLNEQATTLFPTYLLHDYHVFLNIAIIILRSCWERLCNASSMAPKASGGPGRLRDLAAQAAEEQQSFCERRMPGEFQ